jgi:hypothetical protein
LGFPRRMPQLLPDYNNLSNVLRVHGNMGLTDDAAGNIEWQYDGT